MRPVRVGFIPLVDSAGLVVADALGFAREEGLALELTRENSWATLRDKLAIGAIDAAHLLAPITVASKIAAGNPKPPLVALMSLSMNGNAISVSRALFEEMRETAGFEGSDDLGGKAAALAAVIAQRALGGRARLTFAIVHPFSPHNYELRYFLGSAGVDPDQDVDLVVVPPPFVVDHLRGGLIDGFCVGAPWTSVGVDAGLTRVIATKSQIWRFAPEKVLGVREADLADGAEVAMMLIRAAKRALEWSDDPRNHKELARILAAPSILDIDAGTIMDSLLGRIPLDEGPADPLDDFIAFDRDGAAFPWRSHALWFYSQMVRWGQTTHTPERLQLAADAYRPDLYRAAFAGMDVALPATNAKMEGALDAAGTVGAIAGQRVGDKHGFFDGRVFDPSDVPTYVESFTVRRLPARTG